MKKDLDDNTTTWPVIDIDCTPTWSCVDTAGDFLIDMYKWLVIDVRGSKERAKNDQV